MRTLILLVALIALTSCAVTKTKVEYKGEIYTRGGCFLCWWNYTVEQSEMTTSTKVKFNKIDLQKNVPNN